MLLAVYTNRRTVQKLTASVEAPVVDYIKLDLQLKDASLHGCTDIFQLASAENSDAIAIQVNPKFDTRKGDAQIKVFSIMTQ